MSKLVYVVTEGSYSDYRVLAVFSDKALADDFASHYDRQVEEYLMDVPKHEWAAWKCKAFRAENAGGDPTVIVETCEPSARVDDTHNPVTRFTGWPGGRVAMVIATAPTPDLARKRALDEFWKWMAEKEGA